MTLSRGDIITALGYPPAGVPVEGNGVAVSGPPWAPQIDVDNPVPSGNTVGNGSLLIGGNETFLVGNLSPGAGIAVTTGSGTLEVSTLDSVGVTVADLPASPATGQRAYVTDALAPTFLGNLTGNGTVKCPAFYNGAAWVAA